MSDRFALKSSSAQPDFDSAYMVHQDRRDVVSYCLAGLKHLGQRS